MAMAKWGNILIDNGKESEAKSDIWPLIENDLDWVVNGGAGDSEPGWMQVGCDLWEEVRSSDFFWNRMSFIYCLQQAADFADRIGESGAAGSYRTVAAEVTTAV